MEQEQDTPWIQSTEHTNIQKKGNGRQTRRLEHPSSIRLMDHYLKIMNQVDMHKQTVSSRPWLSLKNPTQGYSKIHALKQWKLSNKQEWTN
ncbi:PB1-F2 protein [Influenza A virus (A/swine/Manitoba/D0272/2013(H1N2))]|uniref:Protein PB1-F2 n=11 Tax=Influenza A virus TaxID=11320 RepID=A0A291NT40_9INFA|nr:PB1-F2 protein [Influenza A virus (A/swine/Manitoba/D0272/2013(H1N2))]ALZ44606.1 PB1-F2 protein [Influenza A virus (A/swine/Manitoba/D0324/2014(H1N2))]ALZ46475.1 PB1-F2 protein [Influenza A virus (A/swine/Manitoba/D0363/2014(H3N2))]ALZ46580.1 PB1-F2 protein [Influenza A virus (A/swine/Manitoba/D0373/2015(H3N2))]ATJ01315.1 PB1-F2 protein [Influenza A virus (A/swine/Manitoba/D0414/2015(H3N2))]ATJ01661.1 PB1-F2 protein [Influenza A virus (A/swine/Manitoba/D0431/2015(H3N2))]ATJ01761.1 PB1-F2 p